MSDKKPSLLGKPSEKKIIHPAIERVRKQSEQPRISVSSHEAEVKQDALVNKIIRYEHPRVKEIKYDNRFFVASHQEEVEQERLFNNLREKTNTREENTATPDL